MKEPNKKVSNSIFVIFTSWLLNWRTLSLFCKFFLIFISHIFYVDYYYLHLLFIHFKYISKDFFCGCCCECALEFLTANKSLFENIENSFIEWRISAFKYYKESCAIFQILILVFDPFYYGFQSKLIETCAKELAHK